jgi:hypothetical protein
MERTERLFSPYGFVWKGKVSYLIHLGSNEERKL